MQDFFIGKRNKKIENKSSSLGLRICFVKEISKTEDLKDVKQDVDNYDAVLIKTQSTDMMRRLSDKASANFSWVLVLGTNDMINRACLEHKKTTALVSPEYGRKNDFMSYRNSGLNQVLCKIAHENKKMIIENISEITRVEKNRMPLFFGRIIQNSILCKKYKVKFLLRNFAVDEKELMSKHQIENFEKVLKS